MSTSFLFDESLLKSMELKASKYKMRPLKRDDHTRGFDSLLAQLTTVGEMSTTAFEKRFDEMKAVPNHYFIVVVEDTSIGKLVASGTCLMELKFIHTQSAVAHIEDIVTDAEHRGNALGKSVVLQLKHLAEKVGAYKVILDCSESNEPFYEKACGFKRKEIQMVHYF